MPNLDFLSYQNIVQFITSVGFIPILVAVYFASLVLFWLESKHVKKDRNSIFDQWFITTFLMIGWGRLTYVLTNWQEYFGGYWFYLPYEKYGEEIFFLRAMPWKLFNLWDGGFLFISMFLAYLVFNFLYVVVIKRWRWREMMIGILLSANAMFSVTLYIYGLFISSEQIVRYGLYLMIYVAIFHLFITVMKYLYRRKMEVFVKLGQLFIVIFTIVDVWLISYIFLSQEISIVDQLHVYGFIAFALLMVIMYVYDLRKDDLPAGPRIPENSVAKELTGFKPS